MKNHVKNEQGYSMLITLYTFVFILLLVFSLFIISSNTLKTSVNERIDQSVYYIVEAGLVEKRAELYDQIHVAYQNPIIEYTNQLNKNSNTAIDFKDIFKSQLDENVHISSTKKNDFETIFSINLSPKSKYSMKNIEAGT